MKEIKGLEGIFNSEDVNKFVVLLDSSTDFLAAGFIRNYSVKKITLTTEENFQYASTSHRTFRTDLFITPNTYCLKNFDYYEFTDLKPLKKKSGMTG